MPWKIKKFENLDKKTSTGQSSWISRISEINFRKSSEDQIIQRNINAENGN